MVGSSEIQPFGLNSTIDPSRCRHLKQKFTEPNSKQIACEDAYAWINGRPVPTRLMKCPLSTTLGSSDSISHREVGKLRGILQQDRLATISPRKDFLEILNHWYTAIKGTQNSVANRIDGDFDSDDLDPIVLTPKTSDVTGIYF
jgi:hypothetical protein